MRRVIVLRPEPGASATVERALQRGLDAVAAPLFEIEPVPWHAPEPDAFDALLLTSANALRLAGKPLDRLRALPVHAVGAATAEAACDVGFAVASTGIAGVEELLASINPEIRLLHLAGEDRKIAAGARQPIISVTVYRATVLETADVSAAEGAVALIHSPRAAARFAELVDGGQLPRQSISIAAISPEAARAVGDGWAVVASAEVPTDAALLALAERLCNNMGRS